MKYTPISISPEQAQFLETRKLQIDEIFNKTDLAAVNSLLANTGDTWDDLQSSIEASGGAAQHK